MRFPIAGCWTTVMPRDHGHSRYSCSRSRPRPFLRRNCRGERVVLDFRPSVLWGFHRDESLLRGRRSNQPSIAQFEDLRSRHFWGKWPMVQIRFRLITWLWNLDQNECLGQVRWLCSRLKLQYWIQNRRSGTQLLDERYGLQWVEMGLSCWPNPSWWRLQWQTLHLWHSRSIHTSEIGGYGGRSILLATTAKTPQLSYL